MDSATDISTTAEKLSISYLIDSPPVAIHQFPKTSQELEDYRLVKAISQHEFGAEELFARKFRNVIHKHLTRMTRDPYCAEDLTHDVMLLVIEKLRSTPLEKPHKLRSYVLSTARFLYIGWLRKKDNQLALMDALQDIPDIKDSPEDQYQASESLSMLYKYISNLRVPRDREILMRCYISDQSKPEICNAMGLTSQHYDRVISRARSRLKQQSTP